MYRAKFTRVFSAAHRVWNDPGKCSNVHGHNYRAEVEVLSSRVTDQGFALPFSAVKGVVDDFDHTLIVDVADPLIDIFRALGLELREVNGLPSTEFLAQLIADRVYHAAIEIHGGSAVVSVGVSLRETDGIEAFGEATA